MADLDLDAIAARFSEALAAKPSKGEWTDDGVAALWDSASDVPDLVVALRTAREALGAILVRHVTDGVPAEVAAERARQDAKWGEQNHPNGTGPAARPLEGIAAMAATDMIGNHPAQLLAELAKRATDHLARRGEVTWADILGEEVFEALAEDDPQRLLTELVQVAATAQQWVEAIDRRRATDAGPGGDQ